MTQNIPASEGASLAVRPATHRSAGSGETSVQSTALERAWEGPRLGTWCRNPTAEPGAGAGAGASAHAGALCASWGTARDDAGGGP